MWLHKCQKWPIKEYCWVGEHFYFLYGRLLYWTRPCSVHPGLLRLINTQNRMLYAPPPHHSLRCSSLQFKVLFLYFNPRWCFSVRLVIFEQARIFFLRHQRRVCWPLHSRGWLLPGEINDRNIPVWEKRSAKNDVQTDLPDCQSQLSYSYYKFKKAMSDVGKSSQESNAPN